MPKVNRKTRERVYKKYNMVCQCCGIKTKRTIDERYCHERATIDHILPTSKGGSNQESNMTLMCGYCNSRKGDSTKGDVTWVRLINTRDKITIKLLLDELQELVMNPALTEEQIAVIYKQVRVISKAIERD